MQQQQVQLDHELLELEYEADGAGIYLIRSVTPYFLHVFSQDEIRIKLADFLDDRTAGDYGPVIFPATEMDFVLQAIARKLLG